MSNLLFRKFAFQECKFFRWWPWLMPHGYPHVFSPIRSVRLRSKWVILPVLETCELGKWVLARSASIMFYCNFPFVQDPLLRVSFLRCVSRLSDILSRKQMARHSAKSKELVTFFGRRQQPFPLVTMYIYFLLRIRYGINYAYLGRCAWMLCLVINGIRLSR